jgi:Family of unknown function (DUF6502)
MRELAFVLLTRGITPKVFSEISRSAFVQAAAERSKLRNGRVNHSRVAVQTGLTRADVKRLLNRKQSESPRALRRGPMERVIHGWQSDRQYLDEANNPRPLKLSGYRSSFTLLAKKYAGDVPHRAVLDELKRIGVVEIKAEHVHLKTSAKLRERRDLGSLAAVIPALIDGLRIASSRGAAQELSVQRLQIPTKTELGMAFVRQRCTTSAKAMLDGLDHSLRRNGARGNRATDASFVVTILLAENGNKTRRRGRPMITKGPSHDY